MFGTERNHLEPVLFIITLMMIVSGLFIAAPRPGAFVFCDWLELPGSHGAIDGLPRTAFWSLSFNLTIFQNFLFVSLIAFSVCLINIIEIANSPLSSLYFFALFTFRAETINAFFVGSKFFRGLGNTTLSATLLGNSLVSLGNEISHKLSTTVFTIRLQAVRLVGSVFVKLTRRLSETAPAAAFGLGSYLLFPLRAGRGLISVQRQCNQFAQGRPELTHFVGAEWLYSDADRQTAGLGLDVRLLALFGGRADLGVGGHLFPQIGDRLADVAGKGSTPGAAKQGDGFGGFEQEGFGFVLFDLIGVFFGVFKQLDVILDGLDILYQRGNRLGSSVDFEPVQERCGSGLLEHGTEREHWHAELIPLGLVAERLHIFDQAHSDGAGFWIGIHEGCFQFFEQIGGLGFRGHGRNSFFWNCAPCYTWDSLRRGTVTARVSPAGVRQHTCGAFYGGLGLFGFLSGFFNAVVRFGRVLQIELERVDHFAIERSAVILRRFDQGFMDVKLIFCKPNCVSDYVHIINISSLCHHVKGAI